MLDADFGLGSEICRHPKSAVWRIEEVLDSNGQLMRLLHTRLNTPFTFVAEALLDLVRVKKSILRYSSVARARDFESCTANDTPLVRLQLPQLYGSVAQLVR